MSFKCHLISVTSKSKNFICNIFSRYRRKLNTQKEEIQNLKLLQTLQGSSRRDWAFTDVSVDRETAMIVSSKNKKLIDTPGCEFEGFVNPLTRKNSKEEVQGNISFSNNIQSVKKFSLSGLPLEGSLGTIPEHPQKENASHSFDKRKRPSVGPVGPEIADIRRKSSAGFPALPPKKMLKIKKSWNERRLSDKLPPPPPPVDQEAHPYSFENQTFTDLGTYDPTEASILPIERKPPMEYLLDEYKSSIDWTENTDNAVKASRVKKKSQTDPPICRRNNSFDEGYISVKKDVYLDEEQPYIGFHNKLFLPAPDHD